MARRCLCDRFRAGSEYDTGQCHPCWLWHHDPEYRRRRGGGDSPAAVAVAPALPVTERTARATDCTRRGEATGQTVPCKTCTKREPEQVPTFVCDLHGTCTRTKLSAGVACCRICADRTPAEETAP